MSNWPEIEVRNAAELRHWLSRQSSDAGSHWLIHGKKAAGKTYLPYGEMVEALLAYGWIDSLPRAIDATRTAHMITPRKAGSNWSKANRDRVAKLEREGRMESPGRAAVERAKRDGSWEALKKSEYGRAPKDLSKALQREDALGDWRALSQAVRRRSLEWLHAAKTEATREKRITAIIGGARAGKDPYFWKPGS